MSRLSASCGRFSVLFFWFLLIGFALGLYHWQLFAQLECAALPTEDSIRARSSFYDHFQYRTIGTCRNASSPLFLTIAVLSSSERLLVYLPAILKTWARTATNETEIIIFLEEKSMIAEDAISDIFLQIKHSIQSCLFIVKLKHVENAYPPQQKSFYAMKFISVFYQWRTSWLLRLDDNAYVNVEDFVRWLKALDHRRSLYIGQGGTGRRNGPPIHLPGGKYFCMGGSGIILSRRSLVELGLWLDQCFNHEILTAHEDVELGRCIITHLRIDCTNAYDAKDLFYHHHGPGYLFSNDFTPMILSRALIIHPLKDQRTFEQLFAFYTRRKHAKALSKHTSSSKASVHLKHYVTFTTKMQLNLARDIQYQMIDVRWKSSIEDTVKSYLEETNLRWHQRSFNWTLTSSKFLFGYYRLIPTHGPKLIVEVLLHARTMSSPPTRVAMMRRRLHIQQPFASKSHLDYREIIISETSKSAFQLNLIAVSSDRDTVLMRFVENFQREVLDHPFRRRYFTLTILYFSPVNQTNTFILDRIRQLVVQHPQVIRLSVVSQNQTSYNRGLGRQLASGLFTDSQLLFFLDVDLVFTGQALDNTRRLILHQLSISSCTAYFPIVFSGFSTKFLVDDCSTVDLSPRCGTFSIYGYGNVVVRKQDLDRIGGWPTGNVQWGNEDVDLFERFSRALTGCYVFRAVEPGLRHYYHRKMCHGIVDRARRTMCQEADGLLFGSQANMVDYLLESQNDTNGMTSF